jgi:large subunit ribosomal protein L9
LVAEKIDGVTITLRARVGQQGRLFGSVTALDIAKELSETAGAEVEHRQVQLPQAIRTLGSQEIKIRLTRNVFADVTVNVESEDGGELSIAEVVEAVDAEEAEADAAEAAEAGDGSDSSAAETASEGETVSEAETAKSD